MKRLLILVSLIPCFCFAEVNVSELPPPMPELPDIPIPIQDGEAIELPEITIIHREGKTIHEYRRKGHLFMIKVIPDIGFPYYFIDTDGDGTMEVHKSDLDRKQKVNQWKIFEWN
ncbi:MAG: DUF2782 domain-containing protein [Methylococcales bacterium]|nr:DUF2782 domain-containing protein [Methylococcales bacterium]